MISPHPRFSGFEIICDGCESIAADIPARGNSMEEMRDHAQDDARRKGFMICFRSVSSPLCSTLVYCPECFTRESFQVQWPKVG